MTRRTLGAAAVLTLVPLAVFAQGSSIASRNANNARFGQPFSVAPQPNNSNAASGAPARDGCINVPGEAHNSADCSKIPPSDYNTADNRSSTDLAGRPTGATENAERNARIMNGVSAD